MNQDKAREYFSSRYEGTLEPGLLQAFESQLRSDPTLKADYGAFVELMEELRALPQEEIEIPAFLSDRIATRLEEERARKQKAAPPWTMWLRGLAFAGLAVVAIFGAVRSLTSKGTTVRAEFGPSDVQGEQMIFTRNGPGVSLNYRPSSEHTVIVSSAISGRELERFTADAASPVHLFENKLAGTALFDIQVLGDPDATLLAIPGTVRERAAATGAETHSGAIRDFAVALADRYGTPVLLHAGEPTKHVAWKFESKDPVVAASASLAADHFVVEQREAGILDISDR